MKFKEVGRYNPEALNHLQEVQPYDFAQKSPLRRLDFLLGIIKREKPKIVTEYATKLCNKFREKTITIYLEQDSLFLEEILEPFQNLQVYPNLAYYNLNFFLNILSISKNDDWKQEQIKVAQKNFLRSFLVPKYVNLQVLATILEREEAIQIYKKYITEFLIELEEDKEDKHENLESFSKKYFEIDETDESESWVTVYSNPIGGKQYFRKDVCLWDEALSDLNDLEFKYLVCCYGDFQGIKRENENFILTMEHTIAKGDLYCSCVVHDTRINWEIKHPLKEFWDEIWPLHEWQQRK